MDFNLLFRWMSEKGSGTWAQFRDAHDWVAARAGVGQEDLPAFRTLSHIVRLAHAEMDWSNQAWAVAPPVLTIVPGASVHAVIVGARTGALMDAFYAATSGEMTNDLLPLPQPQQEGPDALLIACTNERDVVDLADELGIKYEYSVAQRLSLLLPQLADQLQVLAAPPPQTRFEVSRWNPEDHRFEDRRPSGPGLYRYRVFGSHSYRFVTDSDTPVDLDLWTGRYAELNRLARTVLDYEPATVNGTLVVPVWADLPDLHARAAIICAGMLPRFDQQTKTRRYPNVPWTIARRIAHALGQQFVIRDGGTTT